MSILFINLGYLANILLMSTSTSTSVIQVINESELSGLLELAQPVSQLFYQGDFIHLLDRTLVAIVGSRKVSAYGRAVTSKLAGDLARAGVVIVSGLAYGVDSIAHQAALDAGGATIAVLPSGLDNIYPGAHHGLAKRIVEQGGALVTEYPAGQGSPMKHQFIARNRIIAALSQAVLITEAAARSGSLHTANFALEQGLDVFAVPGNITSSTSEGTNNLIKTGAAPVTNASDILEALGITEVKKQHIPDDADQATLLALIQAGHGSSDQLQALSKLSPAVFQQTITILELAGAIRPAGNNDWSLV